REHARAVLARCVETGGAARNVGTGAERAPRPCHDDGADVVILVGALEGLRDFRAHLPGIGIELVGPVERDDEEGAVDLAGDVLRMFHGLFIRSVGWAKAQRAVPTVPPNIVSSMVGSLALSPPYASDHAHLDRTEACEFESKVRRFRRKHRLHHAAGHHDLALAQAAAARGELGVEPGDRIEGMAEDVAPMAFAD